MDKRVRDLKAELHEIEERKRRQVRSRSEHFTVGLIGYTNAGKSTLLNRLCGADVLSADMLFATLDTRTRQWRLSDGRTVLLSDTVGFLQRLPHHLVASFHATLEEALHVDLLLHVVDASHPDATEQMRAVDAVLAELSGGRGADVLAFNKIDAVEDRIRLALLREGRGEEVVHLSASTGEGVERLEAAVARRLDLRSARIAVELPCSDGRAIASLRSGGLVEEESVVGADTLRLVVRLRDETLGGLRRTLGERARIEVLAGAEEPFVAEEESDAQDWMLER
jgi:GTP-binding protein HflX